MTDLELLSAAGQALYGDRWQTPMARLLGVSDRTVRRWVAGQRPVPWDALAVALTALNRKMGEMDSLAGRLTHRVYGEAVYALSTYDSDTDT